MKCMGKKRKSKIRLAISAFCILFSINVLGADTVIVTEDSGITKITPPEIVADAAVVVDMKTGYTLYEKDIYTKYYPASITKIMTATLALENLKLTDVLTYSHDAVFSIEPGSSSAYLDEGEQITVEQALYGLMLISGNDVANGLAEAVGTTMDEFAKMMTSKAVTLGCKNTNFANAHGLHNDNHYTCAYDMAIMGRYAYNKFEMFRTLCSTVKYEVPPTNKQVETRYWRNSNRMINSEENYYYCDCVGGKTGFTDQAGGTFVSYANINGRLLMVVLLHSTNSVGAYTDSATLYDYIRDNVSKEFYEQLDIKYAKLEEKESESNASNAVVDANQPAVSKSGSSLDLNDSEVQAKSFSVPQKILLAMLTIFVLYYVYVKYVRYRNRKRRRIRRTYDL